MLFAAVVLCLVAGASALPDDSVLIGTRLPADVHPIAQRLHLNLDPTTVATSGTVVIEVELQRARRFIWLNARGLKVEKATVTHGNTAQTARFDIVDTVEGLARLEVKTAVPAGRATITLRFTGELHDDLNSLYRVQVDGRWYLFSQFEALGAREAFPCFDEPGRKIPFQISVTHPQGIDVVGNTTTTTREVNGAAVTVTFAETQPLPTYLLAFVGGPIDVVAGPVLPPTAIRSTPLSIRGIASHSKGALLPLSLRNTAAVVLDQERAFGIAYPWDKLDIVAVADFAAGAMENAGLITYRDTRLFVDDTSPVNIQEANLSIIAHETAHQWFGDLVTMAWWDDLWLNEAFATWMAARTVQRLRPDFDADLDLQRRAHGVMDVDSLVSARRIREPIANRGDIDNAFDGITYSKGAAVIGMFETWIDSKRGAGTFLRGVSSYLRDHALRNGTTADFLKAISVAADVDVTAAFSSLLDQAGVPLITSECVVRNNAAFFDVSTTRYLPLGSVGKKAAHFALPVCVSFLKGRKNAVRCALVDGRGSVALDEPKCPAAIHPNADGAGYYRFASSAAATTALAKTTLTMTPAARLAFADSITAGFDAGTLTFAEALAAATPLVTDAQTATAMTALHLLTTARDVLFFDDDATRTMINRKIATLYQPVLNRLGFVERKGELPRDRERRVAVADALIEANPVVTAALAAQAKAWLLKPHAQLARDLLPVALAAHVERDVVDDVAFSNLLARAKAEADPQVRSEILRALANTQRPTLADRAIGLLFDDELRVNERALGLQAQAADRRRASHAFEVVTRRYDAVAARLPEDWRAGIVEVGDAFCSAADAVAVEAFFRPKLTAVPGLDRMLAQTTERIRLCDALVKHHHTGARAALQH